VPSKKESHGQQSGQKAVLFKQRGKAEFCLSREEKGVEELPCTQERSQKG
jgi:hypothetical protein